MAVRGDCDSPARRPTLPFGLSPTRVRRSPRRQLLALLSEESDASRLQGLVRRVDVDRSGDLAFEEFAVLVRALNPQLARPMHPDKVRLDCHPLLQQVLDLRAAARWPLMNAQPGHAKLQAERAGLLGEALDAIDPLRAHRARAETAAATAPTLAWQQLRVVVKGGPAAGRLQAMRTVERVAEMMLEVARTGGMRGSLSEYCDDEHADTLSRLAQALAAACELLRNHEEATFESHVAIRCLRTIHTMEQLPPSRPVTWGVLS